MESQKKKHKKNKLKEENNFGSEENYNTEETTKKKNKYSKNEHNNEAPNFDNDIDDGSIQQDSLIKKKKHKKNKNKMKQEVENSNQERNTSQHDVQENTNKRSLEAGDSDDDEKDKPKKKKKKKAAVVSDTTEKKGKKSIRQVKREKHAQRQAEAQAVAKDEMKSVCLNYLSQWKHDRQNWKFMKVKQGWLFKNMFLCDLIPDSSWSLLLEYFEPAKGNIKTLLLENANKIIKQMDDWIESQNGKQESIDKNDDINDSNNDEFVKPDDKVYKRARDVIQRLQE